MQIKNKTVRNYKNGAVQNSAPFYFNVNLKFYNLKIVIQ